MKKGKKSMHTKNKTLSGALKKFLFSCLLALTIASPGTAIAAKYTAAVFVGPYHAVVNNGYKPYLEQIKQASGGELDFNLYPGGALLGARETLSGLRDGVADIGFIVSAYHPAELPYGSLLADMALMANSTLETSAAVTEILMLDCEPCQQEFRRNGVVYLGSYATTSYNLIGKQPYQTVKSLQGKRVRTPGGAWDRWARAIGATPVNVPTSEIFEGLNRGALDLVLIPTADFDAYNLWDVATHVTNLPTGVFFSSSTVTAGNDFWRSLSTDQRATMLSHAAQTSIGVSSGYVSMNEKISTRLANKGIRVVEPAKGLMDALDTHRSNDRKVIIKNAKERGIKNPEAFLENFESKVAKYQKLFADAEGDYDAKQAIVQREIYDKLDPKTYGL
ncbi:C4-dicarboxylate TRAP transporter substrate-binding protein [Marinobacter sp. 2_MG-2023]|uniref:C4-dicarboxylate TRAP transporter substrate-binding protein n=1 Tax=Marinobacter sp. 2_MG-2023 TaxID=3062679 RepID=UPI0026E26125|nr:C4-dicarboxylate TRAP transporter substrate-binding protein [Marinobacter sp. 2_MG-2023]MDO6441444.1 C4-dicarboxylate TRAP transporter substrate-binding protein [Marinobacter sp. 2_MG-2023]